MSIYFFLIVLLIFVVFPYRYNKHHIRPSIALIVPMIISACMIIILQSYIEYEISWLSVFVLVLMLFFYLLGELFSSNLGVKIGRKNLICQLEPQQWFKRFALFILFVNFILQYKFIRDVGAAYGAQDILSSYAANRLNTLELQQTGDSRLSPPTYIGIISILSSAVEIICLHLLLLNRKRTGNVDKYLLFSVIFYFLSLFFNSGRAAFVPFVIHFSYLIIRLNDKPLSSLIKDNKIVLSSVGILLVAIFLILGNLREKSSLSGEVNTETDGSLTAAMYIGGPLVGFDIYANRGMPPNYLGGFSRNEYIGQNVFKGIYDVLRKIGIDTKPPILHEDKFYLKAMETNVFTGFSHLIRDFGLVGALFFIFMLGLLIGHIDTLIKKNRIGNDSVIWYFTMSWIYFSLLAMFYTNEFYFLFSVDFVLYKVLLIYFFMKFGVKKVSNNIYSDYESIK